MGNRSCLILPFYSLLPPPHSLHLSIYLSVCLSVCLSIYLSICPSVCLSQSLYAFHQGFGVAVSRVATNASALHGPQEVHDWVATILKVPHQPLPKAAQPKGAEILEEEQMAVLGCGAAAAAAAANANGGGGGAAFDQSKTEERCRQLERRVEVMETENQQLKTQNQQLQARLSRQQGGAAAAAAAAGAAVGAHAGAPGHSSRAVAADNDRRDQLVAAGVGAHVCNMCA
eukprot:GHVU01108602.1.p1 GENE.GHVU01108602.1~~GHVU01108602.1.p1  ORF type:complete len:229 (-),score=42.43 GHVU01108602.1:11-697(-)